MDDVDRPVDGESPSVKAARMIALISRVDINTRLTLCFVLIIALMSVGTGILLWQSSVMRAQANRLKEMDEQFMEVQRVHALVLSFRDGSEQLVKARNLARLQQEAPVLRNQLNDSLRQTQTVFRGIEPNNTLDPTVLPALETIQGLLPSQIDSLTTLASMADWDALSQRMEQPVETLENLSAELVATASRDLQNKRSEAARKIERAQIRTLFILTGVGDDVVRTLNKLKLERGVPKVLFCDNGSEFTSHAMDLWAYQNGAKIDFSRPGKPTDNAFVESFNGTFRNECLNTHWFMNLKEARQLIAAWREEYNHSRPHASLDDRTPSEFASQHVASRVLDET
jgi:hypothetical protein